MKNIPNNARAVGVLLALIALSSCDVAYATDKEITGTTAVTLNKIEVPKAVTDSFDREYPVTGYENDRGHEKHTLYFQQDGKLLKDVKTV